MICQARIVPRGVLGNDKPRSRRISLIYFFTVAMLANALSSVLRTEADPDGMRARLATASQSLRSSDAVVGAATWPPFLSAGARLSASTVYDARVAISVAEEAQKSDPGVKSTRNRGNVCSKRSASGAR